MATSQEFMLTLPSNTASNNLYRETNKPSCFKVHLPTTLELEGEWEVSIVNIQYPFNWPNFNQELIAVLGYLEKKEIDEIDLDQIFKVQCHLTKSSCLAEDSLRTLYDAAEDYCNSKGMSPHGTKFIKIPTGFYQNPGQLGIYLEKEFNNNVHVGNIPDVQPCSLKTEYDQITQRLKFTPENLNWFQIVSLKNEFFTNIGASSSCWNNRLYVAEPTVKRGGKAFLQRYSSMYIYCDVIKWQVVGDTQTPLLATLPVQGNPFDQCFWAFNPPYYIPVSQKSISTIEMEIRTDTGDLFPFEESGRVVIQLHFRRQRNVW